MNYSRQNPSSRYLELLALYQQLHEHGNEQEGIAPQDMFPGESVIHHLAKIKELINKTDTKALLDYGAGKGFQYLVPYNINGTRFENLQSFWQIEQIEKYDPAYSPFSNLPAKKFDGVICTDVLEHCPEEDVPWILDEIYSYAEKFVYGNIACYPAKKTLPNGENAHCTVKQPAWWLERLNALKQKYPHVLGIFVLEFYEMTANGPQRREVVVTNEKEEA